MVTVVLLPAANIVQDGMKRELYHRLDYAFSKCSVFFKLFNVEKYIVCIGRDAIIIGGINQTACYNQDQERILHLNWKIRIREDKEKALA